MKAVGTEGQEGQYRTGGQDGQEETGTRES